MGNVCVALSDSHKHSKPKLGNFEDSSSGSGSHGSSSFSKQLVNFSWKKLTSPKKARYAPPRHSTDSPVWQRTILMGERCEPLDFSGVILYDKDGNSVEDFPCRHPKLPMHPVLALAG